MYLSPPGRGAMGLGATELRIELGQGLRRVAAENPGGSPTYGGLPPKGGGPMAPPLIGGGVVLLVSLLVIC